MNTNNTNINQSLNSLCLNLTGFTANEIIIRDEDWQYSAEQITSVENIVCNRPEWVANPTEAMEVCGQTFEDFVKVCGNVSASASCSDYTLAQLFAYIFNKVVSKSAEQAVEEANEISNEMLLDDDVANEEINDQIYKKLADVIGKAYLGMCNKKGTSKTFLEGKIDGCYLSEDVSDYSKYCDYVRKKA